MKTNEIIRFDEMSVGAGGVKYEAAVVKAISQAATKFKGHVKIKDDNLTSAGYSNVGVDLEVEVAGKNFAVEIKQNKNAQMGGTSMNYDFDSDEISLVYPDDVDEEVQQLFIDATRSKKKDLIKFITRMKQLTPEPYKKRTKLKLSVVVYKDAWNQAQKEGLLQKLNDKIALDNTDIIAKRYNRKGVYYIQIGGAGLFYLLSNPLKLPVPKFEGQIDIELRLKRGGSGGKPMASATYNVTGRLKTAIKSSLSLDNPADVATVFQTIINGGATTTTTPVAPTKAKAEPKPAAKATKKSTAAPDLKAVKSVGTMPKIDPKQKAKAALASGGKSKKG